MDAIGIRLSLDGISQFESDARRANTTLDGIGGTATRSLGKVETSAAQTAAALRMVPAQFTDIVVSLQSGQAPMTVFLQQGGQLKDMFGGAGAAAKALGGYVVGLISPLTVAAGAAVALGVAYNQGSKEGDAFVRSIAMSGNVAGTTAGELQRMAAAVAAVVGTRGQAAGVLADLVSTGKVASTNLEAFTRTAVTMERVVGVSVDETVKQFAELGASPVEASKKLNERYNYLTASIYEQIKALQQQGDVLGAAALAQKTYDEAMGRVSSTMQGRLGYIERAWQAVGDAAKGAWDKMLNVGRPSTANSELEGLRARLTRQQEELRTNQAINPNADTSGLQKGIEALKQRIGLLESDERMLRRGAEAEAARAQAQKDGIAATDALQRTQDRGLSKQQQLNKALEDYAKEMAAVKAVNPNSPLLAPDAIARGEKAIRDQYKDRSAGTGESEVASIRARIVAQTQYLDLLKEQGAMADKLTEGERLVIKIKEELKTSITGVARAEKERALVAAEQLASVDRQVETEKSRAKSVAESEAAYRRFLDSIIKTADSIGLQADKQEAANASFGKGKTAIEEMLLAQQQLAVASERESGPWDPARIAAMETAIAQQQRYVDALQAGDLKSINAHNDELLRSAREQAGLYEDEARLIGLTGLERAKVVALRQVELKYAKELAAVDKMAEGTEAQRAAKEAQRIKVLEAKQIESSAVVAKVIEEDWSKTSQLIGDTLADYIMGGGKDAAQYLKRLFATLVLQPVVQMGVGSAMGALGLGGGGGASGGASNALSLASNASTVYSLFTGGMASSLGGSIASLGSMFGSSALSSFAAGMQGSTLAAGLMGPTTAGATGAMGLGASAGSLLSAIPGWGWALAGVGALFGGDIISGLFGRKLKDQGIEGTFGGETDFEGRTYQYYKGGLFRSNKTKYGTLDEDLRSGLADQFGALQAGTSEMAKILGLGTDAIDNFTASIKISFNGLDEAGIQNALKAEFEKIAESLSSQTLGTTEFTRNGETAVQTLGRLSGSLSAVNGVFENLSQTLYASSLAGADMASQLVDLFGGTEAFGSATGTYFQNFYSEDEQRAAMQRQLQAALDKLDLTLPDIDAGDARKQWRDLAEAQDLNTEAGRKAWAALIQLSGAFAGITQSAEDAAAAAAAAAAAQARQAEASRTKEEDLQIQLLRAQGNELAAVVIERRREMDALAEFGPAAQDIQRHIWAIRDATAQLQAGADAYFADVDRKAAEQGYVNDAQSALDAIFGSVNAGAQAAAQAAASAAQAAASAWRSAASSIQSSLNKLRADTTAGMDPAARLALTRAQLGGYTAAALGGDVDAASKMASAADAFLQASEVGSTTRAEYLRDRITAEAQLASVLQSSEAKASVQDSIAAAANASVSELQALNANLTGFAGGLYELLSKGYQGADRGAAQTVAQSFAKMQADYDAYFNDLAGFGAVGNKYTDASFNGASFTKLGNNMAAFTGADGIVSYIRAGESLVEVAKRIPELRALWEKNYGIKLPAFAEGGYHAGGLRVVGERGWEIEATGPARIWNQQQIASAMRGGDNGSAQVVQALQTVSAQIARLEQRLAAIEDSNGQMATQQEDVTEGGNGMRAEIMNVKQLAQAIKDAMA